MNADTINLVGENASAPICVHPRSSAALPVPVARRAPIATRVATMSDLPFLDGLQKQHSKQLGFFPRAQMEGYVENGWVLIAEEDRGSGVGCRGSGQTGGNVPPLHPIPDTRNPTPEPLGYCISRDRYLKRDELGVIYQLCVAPGHQRGLIGATLIRDVFPRAAYGCRLFCCWCAQDLDANYFWESLGFVPIAFRGGSGKKRRVHIFWQRRIDREEPRHPVTPHSVTPYWFPAKTDQGAMREDRIVLPIPPGKHWSDEMPVLAQSAAPADAGSRKALSAEEDKAKRAARGRARLPMDAPPANGQRAVGARQYGGPSSAPAPVAPPQVAVEKPKREKAPKPKVDPKLVAAARELRDRYLEHVNSDPQVVRAMGKYQVGRLPDQTRDAKPIAMLPAA